MAHRASLQLIIIIILLGFPFLLSSAAVPTTRRSLLSNREEPSIQTTLIQGSLEFRDGEELMMTEGRMDLESADYPGTGANNHHDPRTPGRA